ncbi:methyltransferase domain-containing protein [Micromonospora sp. RTGN7]|uniref:methyltransferase domain-containing protein n=1 Tax=Micromonospora sp. RTGN7 TaxID=3016526 RepID=UPI0029FF039B|nr:methyltransferase domain-containing protein [Micromonospora sp. RTGN7]
MNSQAVRDQQRTEWTLCAGAWREYRANFVEPSRPITEAMLRLADPRPGDRVLDLACGVGNPAFDIARRVGGDGHVLGLDLVEAMVDGARAVAVELGLGNVEFRTVPDETTLGVPPGSFDAATCRAGLQYMPDRAGAMAAVLDALRPGGRFVAMTLGAAERCMPFRLTNAIVSRHVPLPEKGPEDDSGPVGLSSLKELAHLFTEAGFVDLRTEVFEAPIFEAADPAAAWEFFARTAGPFIPLLTSLPERTRQAIHDDAVRTFGAAFPDGPVRPTGEVLVVCGRRPD